MRMTCNPDSSGGHDQEFSPLKVLCVFSKHGIEVFHLRLQGSSGKPKENDAWVGKCLVKDQLAEIPVSDNQHAPLFPCDGQDIFIGKTVRILTRDSGHVIFTLTKVGNQSKVGALVKEEFHRAASERTPFGGFGETSLPVTIS